MSALLNKSTGDPIISGADAIGLTPRHPEDVSPAGCKFKGIHDASKLSTIPLVMTAQITTWT